MAHRVEVMSSHLLKTCRSLACLTAMMGPLLGVLGCKPSSGAAEPSEIAPPTATSASHSGEDPIQQSSANQEPPLCASNSPARSYERLIGDRGDVALAWQTTQSVADPIALAAFFRKHASDPALALPVVLSFTATNLELEVSIVASDLAKLDFSPSRFLRVSERDQAGVWLFDAACDSQRLRERFPQRIWKSYPFGDVASGQASDPYDWILTRDLQLIFVPRGQATTAASWLFAPVPAASAANTWTSRLAQATDAQSAAIWRSHRLLAASAAESTPGELALVRALFARDGSWVLDDNVLQP